MLDDGDRDTAATPGKYYNPGMQRLQVVKYELMPDGEQQRNMRRLMVKQEPTEVTRKSSRSAVGIAALVGRVSVLRHRIHLSKIVKMR